MRFIYLLIILCSFSCNNERVLQLPEIENAKVTEVLDVSPAYIFYDETQPDSTLMNRKNLIISTNWLVNVDKRLTLRQAIPHIKYLQDKKRNAEMHKNEDAKNYFTCNDTSIENLGFLEFTDVNYKKIEEPMIVQDTLYVSINVFKPSSISIHTSLGSHLYQTNSEQLFNILRDSIRTDYKQKKAYLTFSENMSFQDYIQLKSLLSKINIDGLTIDKREVIN